MSSKPTALVTGATGLLGRKVSLALGTKWEVKGAGYSRASGDVAKIDLNSAAEVEANLDTIKPQVVVHCAANRFPDQCEKDPEGARALNVTATSSLASLCAARDILLIYISTDYVFPGKPGEAPYAETATPSPPNLYGQTKLDGEKATLDAYKAAGKSGKGVVLRVPVLYGPVVDGNYAESAINVLIAKVDEAQEAQRQGKTIKMDAWAQRYPTHTEDVAKICGEIAKKYLESPTPSQLPEILQFSADEPFTKYNICEIIGEIQGLPTTAIEPQGEDPDAEVQRPYDTHLSTQALEDLGIMFKTMSFESAMKRILLSIKG